MVILYGRYKINYSAPPFFQLPRSHPIITDRNPSLTTILLYKSFLSLVNPQKTDTVFVRISVTFSTLHSFISVKKIFDEHVYLTQNAHEP
jgi:hypothetical protein